MNKWIGIICLALIFASCDDNGEKKAQGRISAAEKAFKNGDCAEAKLQLDSIRLLYPEAFNARHQSIRLMQQIDLKEQEQTIGYLDSVLVVVREEIDKMKGAFVLEKNAKYQDEGYYVVPSQAAERTTGRTMLRAQVSESGNLLLTSIFSFGKINHRAVKVTAGDTYAETSQSSDVYQNSGLGGGSEKVDYKDGADGDVVAFVAINRDEPLVVEYIGDKSYKMPMPQADKEAMTAIYKFAQKLKSEQAAIEGLKKAKLKIDFINRRRKESAGQQIAE